MERARDRLLAFRDKIMECAQDAADRFKDAGVSALDGAIAAMGVKKGLEHLLHRLHHFGQKGLGGGLPFRYLRKFGFHAL